MENKNVRISDSEKIGFISNLFTMLSAGIPLLEAVGSLEEDTKGSTKKILTTLKEDIVQGRQIYTSFAKFPEVFDKVTVNVIKASEQAGTLDVTLKDLRDNIKKQMEFNDKVKSALWYPLFLMVVFAGVLLLNLVFVLPKISVVFRSLKVELPLPTKILIFFSDLVVKQTIPVLVVLTIVVSLFLFLFLRKRRWILNIIYSLPLVSSLVKLMDLTRFSRSFYLLLNSGIPITEALDLTSEVVMKKESRKIILKSRDLILAGKAMSAGMREGKGYIPPIMIKLVEAGEKTGTLDKSMEEISEYFDYQVTSSLKTFTALLEPAMLVFVGIIVGGMMLAIIAPMYGLISQVGAR